MSRRRVYLVLMGTCLALFVLAWAVLRHVSVTAAVVVGIVALLIPPVAVAVANGVWEGRGDDGDEARWGWDVEDDQAP